MTRVLVFHGSNDEKLLSRTLKNVSGAGAQNSTVIANESMKAAASGADFISFETGELPEALLKAFRRARKDQIIVLDTRVSIDAENLKRFMAESASKAFAYMPLETEEETIELGDVTPENLTSLITSTAKWPLMCLSIAGDALENITKLRGENLVEIMADLMIQLVGTGEGVSTARGTAAISSPDEITLTGTARCRCLSRAVSCCNIEELFPGHAWSNHQAESAAASYHTLAAMFIRLGSISLANECLALSDSLEDSPRSLALKALIAREKGETLGAVANMISSLQQYELRKRNDDGSHYLTFKPRNLEVINTNLRDGLSALNQHDNETALQHFTTAVFGFDSFYDEYGIKK